MQPLTDYAVTYFKKGMTVIPINPNNKRPMIKFTAEPLDSEKKVRGYWNNRHAFFKIRNIIIC